MSEHDRGRVDTSAAEVYDTLFVPALFGRFASHVADAASLGADESVVDVACGTGGLTRLLRKRTDGPVTGVDINPAMLAVAERHGGDIDYREGDATAPPFADRSVDVATCQFGVMFYPVPAAGISGMARVARRGVVAVWDSIDRSAGYSAIQALFRSELGDDAAASLDAPFAMGAEGVLERACGEAGLRDVTFESVEGTGRFESIDQWVTTEVRGWTLGESITDEQLDDLLVVARYRLAEFRTEQGCVFGMTAKLAIW